jgi:hypothetical protein
MGNVLIWLRKHEIADRGIPLIAVREWISL